jgi:hypothetical protein
MLASQGFNVVKLSRAASSLKPSPLCEPGRERQTEVERFIRELNTQIEVIGERGLAIEDQLRMSEEQFGKLMDELTAYFQEIETIIEIQKYMAYNSVLSQRAAAEEELRSTRDSLSAELEGLLGIGNDIENNMEAVESVEAEVYQTIMQNYQAKLNISYQLEDLDTRDVSCPSGIVADVPKVLYSLADKIQLRT